jgi:hypothetical protein
MKVLKWSLVALAVLAALVAAVHKTDSLEKRIARLERDLAAAESQIALHFTERLCVPKPVAIVGARFEHLDSGRMGTVVKILGESHRCEPSRPIRVELRLD